MKVNEVYDMVVDVYPAESVIVGGKEHLYCPCVDADGKCFGYIAQFPSNDEQLRELIASTFIEA